MMVRLHFFIISTFFCSSFVFSQVELNEVSQTNISTIADEDNEYNDWFEIRNNGALAIDLAGYGVSEDPTLPYQWILPS
jgi:hypothetical protein